MAFFRVNTRNRFAFSFLPRPPPPFLLFAGATRTTRATRSLAPSWKPASATRWSGTSTSCPTVDCRAPLARPSTTCSGTVRGFVMWWGWYGVAWSYVEFSAGALDLIGRTTPFHLFFSLFIRPSLPPSLQRTGSTRTPSSSSATSECMNMSTPPRPAVPHRSVLLLLVDRRRTW